VAGTLTGLVTGEDHHRGVHPPPPVNGADSHTLAPPLYVSAIPAAAADVLALVP